MLCCLASETAPGVRRTLSSSLGRLVLSGTTGGFCSGRSYVLCFRERSSNLPLREMLGHDGSASGALPMAGL